MDALQFDLEFFANETPAFQENYIENRNIQYFFYYLIAHCDLFTSIVNPIHPFLQPHFIEDNENYFHLPEPLPKKELLNPLRKISEDAFFLEEQHNEVQYYLQPEPQKVLKRSRKIKKSKKKLNSSETESNNQQRPQKFQIQKNLQQCEILKSIITQMEELLQKTKDQIYQELAKRS